ncbi:MAG: BadF/BadG/BcrA/BcrD ATPase family protein [Planctomycetaceae bacterium]
MMAADESATLVIGVDGGGTKSAAVVARRPATAAEPLAILGRGRGGPGNPRVAGHDVARASITAAIRAAFADAGLESRAVAAACFGLAGVGLREDRDAVLAWATQAGLAGRVAVVPDGLLPFADAAAEPWGVVLIAGTGSLALALPRATPLAAETVADRCGGWGPLLGDEGSGHAIALAALKAAMRAADGRGPDTILREALQRRFAVERAADLVGRVHAPGVGRRELADAAREVLAAAEVGDGVAAAILAAAAADLAAHVRTLAERNAFAAGVYPLRLTGGLLAGSATLRRLLVESLTAAGREPGSVIVVTDPAAAAARFAAAAFPVAAGL